MDPINSEHDLTQTQGTDNSKATAEAPGSVETYTIRETLGRGGFGTVYLAYDETLQREVALKIPHASLVDKVGNADLYLREARAIASLDHPNIIPVYHAAGTPEIPCYIVTKRIRGCHLGQWSARNRPSLAEIANVLALVSDALSYAHKHGIVHRDIKPGNILIDNDGHPYVADFGLALRDVDPNFGPGYIGTPAYSSPEQVRGEGHRVDGRSDIFSMGVVLYELITGERPFNGLERVSLFDEILYRDPASPKQLNPAVPVELARITTRALSKSIGDRYQSASELAADLRAIYPLNGSNSSPPQRFSDTNVTLETKTDSSAAVTPIEQRVVPKGLRAFDVRDADFFMQLLPGPRDRDGIPEIVRFWKSRIEPTDTEEPINVGIIYGPSGCGKTSLVRAGIIPRLSREISTIYVQATAEGTEQRLVSQIASRSTADTPVQESADVVEAFSTIRRNRSKRTVVFIDQFEQWLFAHPDCVREPLTQALRQCDGEYLQCVLLVRDDFWMGVTRLMQALDLTIAENVNVGAVDLFDARHARSVLAKFGAAYGRLPESEEHLSVNQNRFLDAAVKYLSADGRVICVQLALLTEMLKSRPWDNPTGLFEDGGSGIGMRFFEETFESDKSARRTRVHSEAALRILRALLPESGSRIKGAIRTEAELFEISGYTDKIPFREIISILDRELHLITPTDRVDEDSMTSSGMDSVAMSTGFQLTHDFLIAPIRQWSEYHNRSSKEGMARLRLEEFSELYHARPRPQSLPTITEFAGFRRRLRPATYSERQRTMMDAAAKRHTRTVAIWLTGIMMIGVAIFGLYAVINQQMANVADRTSVERLLDAQMPEAIALSKTLRASQYARKQATMLVNDEDVAIRRRVRAALLVADSDPKASELLANFVLDGPVEEVVEIACAPNLSLGESSESILNAWMSQETERLKLIRAACMMANDPQLVDNLRSDHELARLVKLLVAENPVWIGRWSEGFRPIANDLVLPLAVFFKDETRTDISLNAVNLLTDYAGYDVELLASLLPNAHTAELRVLTETLALSGDAGIAAVREEWNGQVNEPIVRGDTSQPWGSPWWCIGSRTPLDISNNSQLSKNISDRLISCESVIGAHAIVSHKLPLEEFDSNSAELSKAGYRVAEVIPFNIDDDRFISVIWLHDGINSRSSWDITADELRKTNEANRNAGFLPDSVTAYRKPGEDEVLYSAVWIDAPPQSGLIDGDIYIDVPDDSHEEQGWGAFLPRGLGLPRSNIHVTKSDGKDYFTSVRWKTEKNVGYHDAWNMPLDEFDSIQKHGRSSTMLSARANLQSPGIPRQGVTPLWWKELPIESKEVAYQARREHLRLSQQLVAHGYFPVALNVTSFGDDPTPQFCSTWWKGRTTYDELTRNSHRLRNLAITLLLLGDDSEVQAALTPPEFDPANECHAELPQASLRGAMISAFSKFDLPSTWLVERLEQTDKDIGLRRSCAMALALYAKDAIPEPIVQKVTEDLAILYAKDSDPGLRSALESIANCWNIAIKQTPNESFAGELRSIAGDRLVILKPDNIVWLGSPAEEPGRDGQKEPLTPVTIERSFAIATSSVTIEQFLKFRADHGYAKDYASTLDCPIINVSWYDAAKYCRWLSEQEGIPESQMCYPPIEEIKPGMQLEEHSVNGIGYRLPTEAEWEFACRGGTNCGRWFGFDPILLNEHAWTARNSGYRLHPVKQLLPNDYGLFDMLGNAMDQCHSQHEQYPKQPRQPIVDTGGRATINDESLSVQRGGAVLYQPLDARAAQREIHLSGSKNVYITFRIARTVSSE